MRKKEELTKGCMGRAGDEEMTFVLLSRDKAAAATIRYWIGLRIGLGLNEPTDGQIVEAIECSKVMTREVALHKPGPKTINNPNL